MSAATKPAVSNLLQAIGARLQQDRATRELGRADGAAGLWRLTETDILDGSVDVLAYASGWREGRRFTSAQRGS